jgi:ring-1,2-phenylacetyl-CoA epoxidase subunit PaaC
VLRLGDGTDESHRRAQAAVEATWPLLDDVFAATDTERQLTDAGVAVDPAAVRDEVRDVLAAVLDQATLRMPAWPEDAPPRGRLGEHGPELTALVADLQSLARQHPAATW